MMSTEVPLYVFDVFMLLQNGPVGGPLYYGSLSAARRNCGSQCQSLVKRKGTIYSKLIQV